MDKYIAVSRNTKMAKRLSELDLQHKGQAHIPQQIHDPEVQVSLLPQGVKLTFHNNGTTDAAFQVFDRMRVPNALRVYKVASKSKKTAN